LSDPTTTARPRSFFYFALATLVAGATAIGTWQVTSGYQRALEEAKRPTDTITVVGAARDLTPGVVLAPADLQSLELPASQTDASLFLDASALVGEVTVDRILAGEPIRRERLTLGSPVPLPETMLDVGARAVTLKVSRAAGVGGYVVPGSYVDVIVTIRPDANALGANWVTETILQAVRVLAIGDAAVAEAAVAAKDAPTPNGRPARAMPRELLATLEVEPDEAEKLAMATNRGEIYLSLRSRDDFDLLAQDKPLVTNALVGIDARPSPAREQRLAVRKAARSVAPAAPPPPGTTSEVISGSKRTFQDFDAEGQPMRQKEK
jgi:pilus assembly protein CpaB